MGNQSDKEAAPLASTEADGASPLLSTYATRGWSIDTPPHKARLIAICDKLGLSRELAESHIPLPPNSNNGEPVLSGLKNLGATCYMASLLQTMFWTPELRRHVITFPFEPPQRHAKNVAFHLQTLFANMQEGISSINPKAVVDSFQMGESAHREQHDVQELSRVLIDCLQGFIDLYAAKKADDPNNTVEVDQVIKFLYHGHMNDEICCKNCGHTRGSPSVFYDLVLPLCSAMGEDFDRDVLGLSEIKSLEDCLTRLVHKEEIDGVQCDACNGRHAVLKGQSFVRDALPKVLSIQLGRMHYDVETNRRVKLDRMIEIPLTLHMDKWCSPASAAESEDCSYELQSVIVHRGSGYHGHYFVYVRFAVQNTENASDGQKYRWAKFNDDDVQWVTEHEVLEYVNPTKWQVDEAERRQQQQQQPSSASAPDALPFPKLYPEELRVVSVSDVEVVKPAVQEGMGRSESSDILRAVGEVFPDHDAAAAPPSLPPPAPVAPPLPRPSAESYYLIYRHSSLPPVYGLTHVPSPVYIEEKLEAQRKERQELLAEMVNLKEIIPIQVCVGDIDQFATAKLRQSKFSEALSPFEYKLPRLWLAAKRTDTIGALKAKLESAISSAVAESQAPAEAEGGTEQQPQWKPQVAFPALPPQWQFRRYDNVLGTLKGPLLPEDALVDSLIEPGQVVIATEVRQWMLANLPRIEAQAAQTVSTSAFANSEVDIEVQVQDAENPMAFPNFFSISCYSPANVTDIIERMAPACYECWGAAANDVKPPILMTVVVDGAPHVRRGGLLVGRRILLEQDTSRPVDSDAAAPESVDVEDTSSCAAQFIAEANKITVHVFVEQDKAHVSEIAAPSIVVASPPAEESYSQFGQLSPPAATEEPVPQFVLRFNNRMTLKALKLELGTKYLHWGDDVTQYQIIPNGSATEPRSTDSTINTVGMFRVPLVVKLVQKPMLGEGHYEAEILVLNAPVNPLTFHSTITTLAAMPAPFGPKLTVIGPQLTQEELLKQHVSSATVEENENIMQRWRIRLLPAGKGVSMGAPLVSDTVLSNMTSDHRVSASPLRFAIEPITRYAADFEAQLYPEGFPSKLKKSSLVLHLLEWKAKEAEISASLGAAPMELIFNKEGHGEDLVTMVRRAMRIQSAPTTLLEAEDAPLEELDIVPAKIYTLQTHDTVYNKLSWGILAKGTRSRAMSVAAYPLCVCMDDIILVRRVGTATATEDDEWPFVSQKAKELGTMPFFSSSSEKSKTTAGKSVVIAEGNATTSSASNAANSSDEQTKKKRKTDSRETGIVIRAVWELEAEEATQPSTTAAESAIDPTSVPTNSQITAAEEEMITTVPEQSSGVTIDFLEYTTFQAAVHSQLGVDCKICYSEFEQNEVICVLPCVHVFHRDCLAPWIVRVATCPSCSKSVIS